MSETTYPPAPSLTPTERGLTKGRGARKKLTPEIAAGERARRELARRKLREFGGYVLPWWEPAAAHELICLALEDVYRFIDSGGVDGTGALIVEMPPQHGKTTIVSQLFVSWLLGKRPDSRIILTAYGADLAQENSRVVRNIVTGERFAALFGMKSTREDPVEISADSFAKANWNLAEPNRGGIVAVGVGGGTTGKPADLLVVDDPFKNREEAENPLERQKKLRWFTSSVVSRMRKGSAIVIIHTRWHREDLIGEMIKSMETDVRSIQFKIISLPALPLEEEDYAGSAEEQHTAALQGLYRPLTDPLDRVPGSKEPLWEDQFPVEMLEKIRASLESNGQLGDWWALYQQQPRPEEGAFFGGGDFQIIERITGDTDSTDSGNGSNGLKPLRWFRYVDLAISEKRTADFNATVAMAQDDEGNVYLRDMIRCQGWNEFKERLIAAMLSDEERGTQWFLEEVSFQALAFQELMRDRRLSAVSIREVKPESDKVTRARPLQARGKAGKLKLVRGPWVQGFILECLDFPNGRHDDQVDTASGGLMLIARQANIGVLFMA